jgi:hypothetical protein
MQLGRAERNPGLPEFGFAKPHRRYPPQKRRQAKTRKKIEALVNAKNSTLTGSQAANNTVLACGCCFTGSLSGELGANDATIIQGAP